MFKKSILFLAVLFLVASIFTVYEKRIDANDTKSDETYFNKKGLSYFNHGFYKLTPKGRLDEASQYYELAIIEFKKAIEINESFLQAYLNLARVYFVQKRFPEAAQVYIKALELNPTDIDIHLKLVLTYSMAEKYAEAIDQLKTARSLTTDEEVIEKLNGFIEKFSQEL